MKMKWRLGTLVVVGVLGCGLLFSGCSAAGDGEKSPQTPAGDVAAEEQQTITVVDHNDNTVVLPAKIDRVVVTGVWPLPSVITMMLGSAEKLVGISPASMGAAENGILGELFPEILQAKTSFMQGKDLNIEELLLLKPDVVFYNAADTAMGQALTNAGFGAVAVSTSKWDYDILETYRQWIALLSQVFPDYDISAEVDSYSQQIYDLVQERTAVLTETEKKKILFLFKYDDTQMVTSGKHFFGQFWCDAVNGVNVAESLTVDNDNAVITMEQVYAWNPDVIFITNFTPAMPEDLYQNKIGANQWQSVPAVQQKQVYKMPLGSYRTYTPGVDTPITLLWVAKSVYPELFADIDIAQKVAEYYSSLYGVELTADQIDRMLNPGVEAAAGI